MSVDKSVKTDKKPLLPSKLDNTEVYTLLQDFVSDPLAVNPLRIPVPDPFVRHYVHQAALRMDLISASQGGASGVKSNPLDGPVREVVIWKDRQNEIQHIRELMKQFVSDKKADRFEMPSMSPELRYTSRLLARDFGLVGVSDGLGKERHCVLWKAQDKKQIDVKLHDFANVVGNSGDDKLEFPPMNTSMRRFTASVASDLGFYAASEGIGENKHTVVYRFPPPQRDLTGTYLRDLFQAALGNVPELVTIHDIRGALQHAEMPESLGRAAIALVERSPDGKVPINTLCSLVDMKEKELRMLFNAFDKNHHGYVDVNDLTKIFSAMDVTPGSADHEFVKYVVDACQKKNVTKINFKDFANYCAFLDLKDIAAFGVDSMAASSLGFQTRETKKSTSNGVYYTVASSMSGGIANAFSRTCVAPFERVRLQLSVDSTKYNGMIDCLTSIYKKEGIKGLWRGNVLNVIRIAPQGAIAFFAKDFVKSLMPESLRYSNLGLALGSMASGAICMSAVYPLDFVRGRITTSPDMYPSWQVALKQIYQKGGIRGLFEGVHYSNIWAAIYYGVQFYSYDQIKGAYAGLTAAGTLPKIDPSYTGLVIGAMSGSLCVTAAYPFESVRRKLQVQGVGGRPILYNGLIDCFKKTIQAQGITGLYKGLGANMVKTPPSIAITFGTYEFLMKHLFRVEKKSL